MQILLFTNIFLIGIFATVAAQHAYAHFHPQPHEQPPRQHPPANIHIPPEIREHLLEAAQARFQTVLDKSSVRLQHDLNATEERLTKQLEKLGTDIVNKEIERYHTELDQLRKQTETISTEANGELAEHQAELKAKMAEEVEAEKERLLKQIDTKLADAVASFLLETLPHNIDLGAQAPYLTAMLEEHKSDFQRGVKDEV